MNKLQAFILVTKENTYGFITSPAQLNELKRLDQLCQLLVRCGGCRFLCAAQDVEHLMTCIVAGGDYVRDVSFPVGAFDAAARWDPRQEQSAISPAPASPGPATPTERTARPFTARAWGNRAIDEADVGGVVDASGHVQSDADPGL